MTTRSDTPTAGQTNPTASTWTVDSSRSRAEFTVGKRLLFVLKKTVVGRFPDISGTITLDERNPGNSRAELRFATGTLSTAQGKRDTHLKSADWFDAERFPHVAFVSRDIEPVDLANGRYRATGDLTVRDVTKPVILDVQYEPPRTDARRASARFTATTTVNRRDFNLNWQKAMIVPADEVQIRVSIDADPV